MANTQTGSLSQNFVDKRRSRDYQSPLLTEGNNYDSIAELRVRLAALAPGTYTVPRMDLMTANDMVYALRLASADAAGI